MSQPAETVPAARDRGAPVNLVNRAANDPEAMSGVRREVRSLYVQSDRVSQSVARLEERLDGVLRPAPPKELKAERPTPGCALAYDLTEICMRLAQAAEAVEDLLARLDI